MAATKPLRADKAVVKALKLYCVEHEKNMPTLATEGLLWVLKQRGIDDPRPKPTTQPAEAA